MCKHGILIFNPHNAHREQQQNSSRRNRLTFVCVHADAESGGDDAPADAIVPVARAGAVIQDDVTHVARDMKLLKDWLIDSIPLYSYFSCYVKKGGHVHDDFVVSQLLAAPRDMKLTATYDFDKQAMRSAWNLQQVDIMDLVFVTEDTSCLDAFDFRNPSETNLIQLIGADVAARTQFKSWTRCDDAVYEGCFSLQQPSPLTPCSSMQSKTFPILALWDELEKLEFVAVSRRVTHKARAGLFYDAREKYKRAYLQCVLLQESLRQKGQVEFVSGQLSSYYELVLRRPGAVMPNCSGKDYQRQLKSIEDGLPALPDVPDTTTGFGSDIDADERAVPLADGGDAKAKRGAKPVPAIADKPPSPAIDTSSSSYSDSSSPSDDKDGASSVDGDEKPKFPKEIMGERVHEESHGKDAGLRMGCPFHGSSCRAFRSLSLGVDVFGPFAPVYYLHAWAKAGKGLSKDQHSGKTAYKPTRSDIRAVIVAHYS